MLRSKSKRFMLAGTNDGNSIASAKSAFGSSSNLRVFNTPTIVSGVSSKIGSRVNLCLRAAAIISSGVKSSSMLAISERGFITSSAVRRSSWMISCMASRSDRSSTPCWYAQSSSSAYSSSDTFGLGLIFFGTQTLITKSTSFCDMPRIGSAIF